MATTRTEKDSMGAIEVPLDAYYGAQTQRARRNFQIIPGTKIPGNETVIDIAVMMQCLHQFTRYGEYSDRAICRQIPELYFAFSTAADCITLRLKTRSSHVWIGNHIRVISECRFRLGCIN